MTSPVHSYETAVAELETILEKMSSDAVTLEESIQLYARAAQLIADCDRLLKEASLKIETIDQALEQLRLGESTDA